MTRERFSCAYIRAGEVIVPAPAVRQNGRSWVHSVANKRHEAGTRSIGNMTHPHSTKPLGLLDLDGDDNDRLGRATTVFSAALDASKQSLVNLYFARQPVSLGAYHGDSKALQHCPRRPIARTQRALECLSRQTVLGRRHMPSSFKPRRQRCSRLVEDRPYAHRRLVPTGAAHQATPRLAPRHCRYPTSWADESFRPAQSFHIGGARYVVGKHPYELTVGPWVISPSHQHDPHFN